MELMYAIQTIVTTAIAVGIFFLARENGNLRAYNRNLIRALERMTLAHPEVWSEVFSEAAQTEYPDNPHPTIP